MASFPPHSTMAGTRLSEHGESTRLPVAVEPVNAILSTPARHSAAPVSPNPVTSDTMPAGAFGFAAANESTRNEPMAVVYSLGLRTTAFPAARAYAII